MKIQAVIASEAISASGESLVQLLQTKDADWYANNVHTWVYDEDDPGKEAVAYLETLNEEHNEKSLTQLDGIYATDGDPERLPYDKVIDCYYERRNRQINVAPTIHRLYPSLAKKLKEKGWWALPYKKINKRSRDGKLLDAKSADYIANLLLKKPPVGSVDWDLTVKRLRDGDYDTTKPRIRSNPD